MLTQIMPPEGKMGMAGRRFEILVDGFVPDHVPEKRIDISVTFKSVARYLKEKGFAAEGCADKIPGMDYYGGDFSGIPWNKCGFDVSTDVSCRMQCRIATALGLVTGAINFR